MDIMKIGYLTEFATKVLAGTNIKDNKKKLNTPQLMRISTIYGHLAKVYDLYDLLFEQDGHELDVDGTTIHTNDLKMFALMDWSCVRFKFWSPSGGKATSDTIVCGGVPLALAGARRVFGKPYMAWLGEEDYYKCDMFLPRGLNSYVLDDKGKIVPGNPGIIAFYQTWQKEGLEYSLETVNALRHKLPAYATANQRPIHEPANRHEELYNKATSKPMRALLVQGWCWTNACRCEDMVTDYTNWDKLCKSADTSFGGIEPQVGHTLPSSVQRFLE